MSRAGKGEGITLSALSLIGSRGVSYLRPVFEGSM